MATGGERTVLGRVKTKNVDVVVTKNGIGPCIAISHKGVLGAFRNLTNRMEEAVGDCTNIHIAYPALVYGFFVAIRANRRSPEVQAGRELVDSTPGKEALKTADLALHEGGEPAQMIARFHQALRELTGRRGVRNDVSRYEAIALALVDPIEATRGDLLTEFPPRDSPLRFERFFSDLYRRYDERYVYGAPDLAATTRRVEWSPDSPLFGHSDNSPTIPHLDYEPRLAEPS